MSTYAVKSLTNLAGLELENLTSFSSGDDYAIIVRFLSPNGEGEGAFRPADLRAALDEIAPPEPTSDALAAARRWMIRAKEAEEELADVQPSLRERAKRIVTLNRELDAARNERNEARQAAALWKETARNHIRGSRAIADYIEALQEAFEHERASAESRREALIRATTVTDAKIERAREVLRDEAGLGITDTAWRAVLTAVITPAPIRPAGADEIQAALENATTEDMDIVLTTAQERQIADFLAAQGIRRVTEEAGA